MVPEHMFWQSPKFMAQMQFWGSPDLVAQLLSFLDVSSTLALANVLPLAQDLLQRKFIWGDLIRRSNIKNCDDTFLPEGDSIEDLQKQIKINETEVAQLVNIAVLKMVKDPKLLLQELLDAICERFVDNGDNVTMSCSRHHDHQVDMLGFELLELVEGIMGTSLQQIKELYLPLDDRIEDDSGRGFEVALTSRLSRQTEQLLRVEMESADIESNTGLNATILQKTLVWDIGEISLLGDLGEEGWSWLAKSMQRNKDRVEMITISSKQIISKSKKGDLKTAWDATSQSGLWRCATEEREWETLKRYCGGFCCDCGDSCTDPEHEMCRSRYRDEDEEGEIVDCGWKRLEEIWAAEKISS